MSKPNEVSFAASICELLVDVLLQSRNGIPADFNLSTVYTETIFISSPLTTARTFTRRQVRVRVSAGYCEYEFACIAPAAVHSKFSNTSSVRVRLADCLMITAYSTYKWCYVSKNIINTHCVRFRSAI